jgi:ATP-binding cassette subfamily C (CFTR/MRP) protein 1
VWFSYTKAAGRYSFIILLILVLVFSQAFRVGADFWLVIWVNNKIPAFSQGEYVGLFWGLAVSQFLSMYIMGIFFAYSGTKAAKTLHNAAIARVIRAPMSFFDTTPLGRIINRFSKDMDGIDNVNVTILIC